MTSSPSERDLAPREAAARLEAFYGHVAETAMRGLPMMHAALGIRCVEPVLLGREWLGVLITPWFMNLVLLPAEPDLPAEAVGTKSFVALPCGTVEFIQSHGEDIGPHRMCSLFSPVFEFETMEAAVLTAEAVLEELMRPQASSDADDGMQAIWEGRLGEAEAQAEAEREEARLAAAAERSAAGLSRRMLFGLPEGRDQTEALP